MKNKQHTDLSHFKAVIEGQDSEISRLTQELEIEVALETALENVRSASMTMKEGNDLSRVVATMYQQLDSLKILNIGCEIILCDKEHDQLQYWSANVAEKMLPEHYNISRFSHSFFNKQWEAWETAQERLVITLTGEEKREWENFIFEETEFRRFPKNLQDFIRSRETDIFTHAWMKFGLLEAVHDEPLTDQEFSVLKRFAKVFEQTYTRFLDLKKAEAQTREAQIETALEKVRSSSLSMQQSEELRDVVKIVFQKLQDLDFTIDGAAFIVTHFDVSKNANVWIADNHAEYPSCFETPYIENPCISDIWNSRERGVDFFSRTYSFEEKNSWFKYAFKHTDYKTLPDQLKKWILEQEFLTQAFALAKNSIIGIHFHAKRLLSQGEIDILKRFSKVFEQGYIRFLDLQKAEALAREAQIEAGLERVRARTMAMQNSQELSEVAVVLFQQIKRLGIDPQACGVIVFDPTDKSSTVWLTPDGNVILDSFSFPLDIVFKRIHQAWENKEAYNITDLKGKKLQKHLAHIGQHMPVFDLMEVSAAPVTDRLVINAAFFKHGFLGFNALESLESEMDLLLRFATVFEQTYTRFLDLQRAEVQAREAQIEAALERVRTRTMAMHKSEELRQVVFEFYRQIHPFGLAKWGFEIKIAKEDMSGFYCWISPPGARIQPQCFDIPTLDHWVLKKYWSAYKKQLPIVSIEVSGDDKRRLAILLLAKSDMKHLPKDVRANIMETEYVHFSVASMRFGLLKAVDCEAVSPQDISILTRFAQVFEQTYTRFLDLKKAEAQAREAQIEAALERVRASAMAMHASKDLHKVAEELRKQIGQLDYKDLETCAIHLYDESPDYFISWAAMLSPDTKSDIVNTHVHFPKSGVEIFEEMMEGYNSGKKDYVIVNEGKKMVAFLSMLKHYAPAAHQVVTNTFKDFKPKDVRSFWTISDFSGGSLVITTITRPDAATHNLLRRLADVFGLAYQRFADLKKAEAQAREAEVQLALERVRARTMAMQKSDELREVASALYEQMSQLKLGNFGSNLVIFNEDEKYFEIWVSNDDFKVFEQSFLFRNQDHPVVAKYWSIWKNQKPGVIELKGSDKIDYDDYVLNHTDFKLFPEDVKKSIRSMDNAYFSCIPFSYGLLAMIDNSEPLNPQGVQIIGRFAKVFDQTYTRFLDLQKAEAQAREAQIEAALERVRSRTMAMHNSTELLDVVTVLYQQLKPLGLAEWGCTIKIFEEDNDRIQNWFAEITRSELSQCYYIKGRKNPIVKNFWENWKKQLETFSVHLIGKSKRNFDVYLLERTDYKQLENNIKKAILSQDEVALSYASYKFGLLEAIDLKPVGIDKKNILVRFAKVFEQTYTRFLDLQKAEAQAREAKIEASLERVRAKTMAMHRSKDLREVIAIVYQQLYTLDFIIDSCSFNLFVEASDDLSLWIATPEIQYPEEVSVPYFKHPVFDEIKKAKQGSKSFMVLSVGRAEKDALYSHFYENSAIGKMVNAKRKKAIAQADGIEFSFTISQHHSLSIGNFRKHRYTARENNTIARFSQVFEQTYTRFLDLQKAEQRVREAEIEACMERVRSRAMAMHRTNELNQVVGVIFEELKNIGFDTTLCSIGIYDKETKGADWWSYIADHQLPGSYHFPYLEGRWFREIYDAWIRKKSYHYIEMYGKEKDDQVRLSLEETGWKVLSPEIKTALKEAAKNGIKASYVSMTHGMLEIVIEQRLSEERIQLLKRFTKVIDLTYTRVDDLEKAEAREKEAVRQASLDRVRAEIASMRTASDLERITPLIWRELTTMEVPFFRCGVFIIDEVKQTTQTYLSTPSGESLAALQLGFDNSLVAAILPFWKKQKIYLEEWDKKEFLEWTQALIEQGKISSSKKYQGGAQAPEKLVLQFIPFSQGMIYIGTTEKLASRQLDLAQSLADAFSVAYARYEDFSQLETAKESIETTLSELKEAQNQLIHAEKMASLGELTAGIAHEIQNPLNFVNNFSEVNAELIEELNEEINKGDLEEVKAIAKDIGENAQKIVHHGKRADGIVKSMLHHSRSSSGEKESTDINLLADEYLRLTYHGLRARDKSFNAGIRTDFDNRLGKIQIVPQEIGRVLLNLINNAFHACKERSRDEDSSYAPEVAVSTRRLNDTMQISVKDNGGGIPEHILDKIFQPFFTTKATGEGTGLGLSLSYDIIKMHAGELKVKTVEGVGTEFIIELPLV